MFSRCVAAKGEDAPECDKFAKYYRSLCPGEWVSTSSFLLAAYDFLQLAIFLMSILDV